MRLALAVLSVLALSTATASAGPGGKLAGTLDVSWDTAGWTGQVGVALDPGNDARDAAVARIRSAQHYRTGDAFSTEGAHITNLSSVRGATYDCGEGTTTNSSTYGPVSDGNVPFVVDRPELDLLRGTGHISVEPAWDNAGDPLPQTGLDFFPVPGAVAVTRASSGCGESFPPTSEDDTAAIFGTDTEVAVPFGVPIYLRSFEIPLRRTGSTWAASGTVSDRVLGSLPIQLTYDLRLLGAMKTWVGICVVPGDKELSKARSSAAAVAIMRKAGFPGARFAGRQATRYHRRGRYFVDEKFTSSGFGECLAGRPKVFLATRA